MFHSGVGGNTLVAKNTLLAKYALQSILNPSLGVAMPEAIGTPTQSRAPRLTLNSDGQQHTALNVATVLTFFGGIAAFALGFVVSAHVLATIIGVVVFGLGMVTQLMSATREQRIFVVAGIIAAGVGAGLALAHGGFG